MARRRTRSAGRQRPASGLGPPARAKEKEEAPLNSPTPRRVWKFAIQHFHLLSYFRSPGDGRASHKIPAKDLLWSIVLSTIVRQLSFLAIEALVRSRARRNLNVGRRFGDDALGYFTARLDPAPTRAALAAVLHRAKRNKAFEDCHFVGLALDGTTGGRRRKKGCPLCRPYRNDRQEIVGYRHHLVLAAVVGRGPHATDGCRSLWTGRQRIRSRAAPVASCARESGRTLHYSRRENRSRPEYLVPQSVTCIENCRSKFPTTELPKLLPPRALSGHGLLLWLESRR
jgi:hypothetical protein